MTTPVRLPKPDESLPPCPHCKGEERYRLGERYARCLTCGKTFDDAGGDLVTYRIIDPVGDLFEPSS